MERIVEEIREDLSRRIALTADRLADRTLAEDAAYAALLGRPELRERFHHTLSRVVEALARDPHGLPSGLADARATGSLRAGQGLPLASLLRAYRLGGRLLWQTLTEAVAAHDPAALPGLLPGAAVLWDVLDQLTDAAAESYRRAEAVHRDAERERRAALLDGLLDGTASDAADAAARLGLPERGRFAVVVLAPGDRGPGDADTPPGAPPGAPRIFWRIRSDGESGLVELGHHPLESVRELLAPLGVRAGVSPVVRTPPELAPARRLAVLALRSAPAPDGPPTALLDERLPAALVAAEAELAGRLRQVVLGPVLALPAAERLVLLTTLGTWLACHGSTTHAAQRLYCHRNTVSNRLRRLEHLTGRTLSDPAHVVELALAHTAVVQQRASAPQPPRRPPQAPPVPRTAPTPAGTARRSPRLPG
ncbi:PucR family transcriptional regulator [Streptomyces sp. NPDC060031]|uniref:PucR family transcriptional regulator n=1 Tax=Streptomyces sp. NPDC060031 TaxID=3347043 RepID=UPI0036C3DA00